MSDEREKVREDYGGANLGLLVQLGNVITQIGHLADMPPEEISKTVASLMIVVTQAHYMHTKDPAKLNLNFKNKFGEVRVFAAEPKDGKLGTSSAS